MTCFQENFDFPISGTFREWIASECGCSHCQMMLANDVVDRVVGATQASLEDIQFQIDRLERERASGRRRWVESPRLPPGRFAQEEDAYKTTPRPTQAAKGGVSLIPME